jgi:hypothetical protein
MLLGNARSTNYRLTCNNTVSVYQIYDSPNVTVIRKRRRCERGKA